MDTVSQSEIKQRMKRYRLRRALGFAAYTFLLIHLVFVTIKTDHMIYYLDQVLGVYTAFTLFFSFLLIHIVCLLLSLMFAGSGAAGITYILSKECDPFLYEACLIKATRFSLRKDAVRCNQALAQYHQGNFPQAFHTLQQVNRLRLKGPFKFNYYLILSSLYFRQDMGDRVSELEEEFRSRIQNSKDKKLMQLLYANNNVNRAQANKDLTAAYRFLQECFYLSETLNQPWSKVVLQFQEAKLDLASGHKLAAQPKLEFVAARGNRLYCAQEARRLLAEAAAQRNA